MSTFGITLISSNCTVYLNYITYKIALLYYLIIKEQKDGTENGRLRNERDRLYSARCTLVVVYNKDIQ
jgi:hypothetical protein